MDKEQMALIVTSLQPAIKKHLNREFKSLKESYLYEMQSNFDESDDGYDNFADYLDGNAAEYVEFALATYWESLIEQLSGITPRELAKTLTHKEKDAFFQPCLQHFLKKTCWISCCTADL